MKNANDPLAKFYAIIIKSNYNYGNKKKFFSPGRQL